MGLGPSCSTQTEINELLFAQLKNGLHGADPGPRTALLCRAEGEIQHHLLWTADAVAKIINDRGYFLACSDCLNKWVIN